MMRGGILGFDPRCYSERGSFPWFVSLCWEEGGGGGVWGWGHNGVNESVYLSYVDPIC